MITKTVITKYENEEGFEFTFEPIEQSLKIVKTKDGYEARYIIHDNIAEDPRDWDNLGHMFCFHKRYTFGDKYDETSEQFNDWDEIEKYLYKEKKAVICLPLFVYDHSTVSMRTYRHGQHSAWDCGQVGFIYVTAEDIQKCYNVKRISKTILKRAEDVLTSEVDTYDKYLQGDVYCLVKETYTKDKEKIDHDTVGGFFGYYDAVKALDTEI